MKYYKIPAKECVNTIEIKKSVFITNIAFIDNIEDAVLYTEKIKKEHYKANHNCYAYIIGENSSVKKFSDDGEPSGTAGRPILSVLESSDITNIICVVTRYFGGIKLGASGLVRAYTQAASECIKIVPVIKKIYCNVVQIKCDYSFYQKIIPYYAKKNIFPDESLFEKNVVIRFNIPISETEIFLNDTLEFSNGTIIGDIIAEKYIDVLE